MPTYRLWRDLRARTRSPEARAARDREDEQELLDLDLRAIRALLGKTQLEVAEVVDMTQSEVSRLERRGDHRVSTLRRVVEALGGELEVIATFGDRRVRLHAAG